MKFSDFLEQIKTQIISFWKLGEGSYNEVLLTTSEIAIEENPPQHWVVKQPKQIFTGELPMNMTSRLHRKFAEIYPDIPVFNIEENQGVVLPFFKEAPNDDQLLAETVLSIYQNSRVIIADGGLPSNFGFYEDKLVCIDMDLALRRGSFLSDAYYNQVIASSRYDRFFDEVALLCKTNNTLELIKTLFYIENQLDGVMFDTQLITYWIIERLHVYRSQNQSFDLATINFLKTLETAQPEIDPALLIPGEIENIKSQNLSLAAVMDVLVAGSKSERASLASSARGFFESLSQRSTKVDGLNDAATPDVFSI